MRGAMTLMKDPDSDAYSVRRACSIAVTKKENDRDKSEKKKEIIA